MALRKMSPRPTAKDMAIADRVRRARAAQPPRDPTGEHHETIAELARLTGRDVVDLLDVWDERAAVRTYDSETNQAEAERLAVEDVRAMYVRQTVLL